ncbi:MAG TPA: hypothetical protein VIC71_03525 [Gammaproteobacteria bacterium]
MGRGLIACVTAITAHAWAEVPVEAGVLDALASGRARVVVELRIGDAFHPEGTLSESAAAAQRQAILAAQQATLTALEGVEARVLQRPATVPFLTLDVGPDALYRLKAMPELVVRIFADSSAAAN